MTTRGGYEPLLDGWLRVVLSQCVAADNHGIKQSAADAPLSGNLVCDPGTVTTGRAICRPGSWHILKYQGLVVNAMDKGFIHLAAIVLLYSHQLIRRL